MVSPQRKTQQQDFFDKSKGDPADIVAMPAAEPLSYGTSSRKNEPRIGELLKREREKRGYDLQQIADYLCIRRSLLVAIEESRYNEFPADAYVIGFLRSYADLIGIPGQDAVDQYRHEMAGRRRKPDLVMPAPVSEGRAPTAVIMGIAAAVALVIYILWYAFSTSDRATVITPPTLPPVTEAAPASSPVIAAMPVPATAGGAETLSPTAPSGIALASPPPAQKPMEMAAPATPAPVAAVTAPAMPTVTPTAQVTAAQSAKPAHDTKPAVADAGDARIVIKADQSSWVLISDSQGHTVYDHVMKPGETYTVPENSGLVLTTGNGAGIALTVDGVEIPRLALTTSHIVRNVPLEPRLLRTRPAAAE